MKSTSKRTKVLDRRKEVAELYLKGWTQSRIAQKLGITQASISGDIKAIHQQWIQSSVATFDEAMARELEKINKLEQTYWDAWERSLELATTKIVKQKGAKTITQDGEETKLIPIEATQKSEEQVGDPRFLDGVRWCIERRCKLFGLDAPTKVDHSWRSEIPPEYDPDDIEREFVELMKQAITE